MGKRKAFLEKPLLESGTSILSAHPRVSDRNRHRVLLLSDGRATWRTPTHFATRYLFTSLGQQVLRISLRASSTACCERAAESSAAPQLWRTALRISRPWLVFVGRREAGQACRSRGKLSKAVQGGCELPQWPVNNYFCGSACNSGDARATSRPSRYEG